MSFSDPLDTWSMCKHNVTCNISWPEFQQHHITKCSLYNVFHTRDRVTNKWHGQISLIRLILTSHHGLGYQTWFVYTWCLESSWVLEKYLWWAKLSLAAFNLGLDYHTESGSCRYQPGLDYWINNPLFYTFGSYLKDSTKLYYLLLSLFS